MPESPEGLYFLHSTLARGARRDLPPGSLWASESGPLWRELRNLGPREGRLKRREGVAAWAAAAPVPDHADVQEVRRLFRVRGSGSHKWILVATDDIFWGDENGWTNITPVHVDGTVSVTNGTTAVTGVGTSWVSRGIQIGNLIELPLGSGDWYEIAGPLTATGLTLTTNYTGTTLVGESYRIRRLLAVGENSDVFFAMQNENAYLAGLIGGNGDLGVVKLQNALGSISSGSPPLTEHLVSGLKELEVGIDVLGYQVTRVLGLEALQDGRLIVPIHWADTSPVASGNRRNLYSSHLSDAVWTSSPGGATDIQGPLEDLTGLVSSGRSYEFHFRDAIVFGELTGQDDPPLSFSRSSSDVGMLSPGLHVRIPGGRAVGEGTLFLDGQLNLYLFSGISSAPVDLGFKEELEFWLGMGVTPGGNTLNAHFQAHGRHDPRSREVEFFFPDLHGTTSVGTPSIRLNYDSGDLYSCFYAGDVTASETIADNRLQRALLGTRSHDQAGAATAWVYEMRESAFVDALPNTTDEATQPDPGVHGWSDFIDFGSPFELKVVKEIAAWFDAGSSGSETVHLLLERDGVEDGSPLTASVTKIVDSEVVRFFYPTEKSMALLRVKLSSADDDTFSLFPTRMAFFYTPAGDVRCV